MNHFFGTRLKEDRGESPEKRNNLRPASRAAADQRKFMAFYFLASFIWIVGTDILVGRLGLSHLHTSLVHVLKGFAYVGLVGILPARLVGYYVRSAESAQQEALDAQLELVTKLARAVEYRDDETGGHNQRIACYARILAREVGLDEETCEVISFASVLHDVGKIGIPDAVLLKPGPLTAAERKIIERHTILGSVLLEGTTHAVGRLARSIALNHHERWDGSGYPNSLKSEEIPLEARIIAVCDVYDALTSKRLYKSAWSSELAVAEIVRGSGKSFDPSVVDAFLRVLPEIRAIREDEEPFPNSEEIRKAA